MTNLLKIQRDFSAHLIDRKKTEIIKSTPYNKLEALARLNIYHNNISTGFSTVLSNIFSVTKKILKDDFAIFCNTYQKKYSSKSGNLDQYGEFFPKLLEKHKIKYLSELANLELTYYRSYFAADAKTLFDLAKFKKITPQNLGNLFFTLHPSCVLISSKFPLYSIWNGKKPKALKPEYIVVERLASDSNMNKISQEEFLFLSMILQKKSLYQIYIQICKKFKKNIDIGKMLNRFIACELIIDFDQYK